MSDIPPSERVRDAWESWNTDRRRAAIRAVLHWIMIKPLPLGAASNPASNIKDKPSAGNAKWRSCGSASNSTGAFSSRHERAAETGHGDRLRRFSGLSHWVPFMACAFARWPGCGDVTQDRGEHRDRRWIFDPLGQSVLDSWAPRVFRAGFPDGFPLLVAHGGLLCGDATFRARPIVRPAVCVRAFTCRRARGGRDGTTGGTITHGDGSSVVRARQCPRLTWTARPASACSRRCRYSLVRFIPVMRMSSAISVPSSGARQSASHSASSAVRSRR